MRNEVTSEKEREKESTISRSSASEISAVKVAMPALAPYSTWSVSVVTTSLIDLPPKARHFIAQSKCENQVCMFVCPVYVAAAHVLCRMRH